MEDEELSQFTLLYTDALEEFQQYSDGKHHTCQGIAVATTRVHTQTYGAHTNVRTFEILNND